MLRVYITDLSAYNSGYLVGKWIELPEDEEAIMREINEILRKGESVCKDGIHEEYFISDYEWENVYLVKVDEYEDIYHLNKVIGLLDGFDDTELRKIKILMEYRISDSVEDAIEDLENMIIYENSSMKDIAEEYVSEIVDLDKLPPLISSHIDYDGIGRDIEIDGSFFHEGNDIFQYLG